MWGESNMTISYEVLLELMSKLSGLQKALFSLPINLVEYNLAAHDDQTFQLLFTPLRNFLLILTDRLTGIKHFSSESVITAKHL